MARLCLGGGVMYYKIRIIFDRDCESFSWIEEYVSAKNREEVKKYIPQIVKNYEKTQDYQIEIQETSIDEMIECEKEELWSQIQDHYLNRKYDMNTITIRRYFNAKRELKKDKAKLYEMLKDESRYLRICEHVKKKIDKSKVTLLEFEEIVLYLYNAKTN